MPDVYAKGQPHVPVADIGGHYVGMHAPERPEVFKPEKLWWRGDEVEALRQRWVQQDLEILAQIAEMTALKESSRKVAEQFCIAEATYLRRIAELERARDLSAEASATMRDESIAKSARIAELDSQLAAATQRRPPKRAS